MARRTTWDTAKYIRRMAARLGKRAHACTYDALIYEHGTHFVFPQSQLDIMLPVISGAMVCVFWAGRQHRKACRLTRSDIDQKITACIKSW